ncbi:cytochrome P450, partial [Escherichia coli]|uniref:cytochrome P450 n=1 Tax=Escherichia coli TaxID=562 RepID=UPI003B9C98CA
RQRVSREEREMDSTALTPSLACLIALVPLLLVLLSTFRRANAKARPSLPRPWTLPIIGNLHQLSSLPHRSLHRLSCIYGPLMRLKLGGIPAIVISSPETAKEVLKTHDINFSGRGEVAAPRVYSYNFVDVAASSYSEDWRNTKSFFVQRLLTTRKINSFRPIREEEVDVLMNSIKKLSHGGELLDVGAMALRFFNNTSYRMSFGRRQSGGDDDVRSRFHELITESMGLLSGLRLEDFFPSLSWISALFGGQSIIEKYFVPLDQFLEEEVVRATKELEEEEYKEEEEHCFLKTMLLLQRSSSVPFGLNLTRDRIKALVLNMLLGASDTSGITVEWALAEMINNPRVMERAQAEVRQLADKKPRIEENDVESLPYLKKVVKETLRLHPPNSVPFRESLEDCKILGHHVPAKTRVLINVWAINRDPRYWEEPDRFWPERFDGKDTVVDYRRHSFQFLPFGGGKRTCPGISLALHGVELLLANLLLSFDWELPEGKKTVDMAEIFRLGTPLKNPLLVKPIPVAP